MCLWFFAADILRFFNYDCYLNIRLHNFRIVFVVVHLWEEGEMVYVWLVDIRGGRRVVFCVMFLPRCIICRFGTHPPRMGRTRRNFAS